MCQGMAGAGAARARRSILLLFMVTSMAGGEMGAKEEPLLQHNETTTTELRPEYTHPAGVEAFDPYNSEKNFHHQDDEEEDEPEQETADHGDAELPEIPGDHLSEGMADDLPIFLLEPEHAYAVKNKPATLKCIAANALQVYFKCNDVRAIATVQLDHVDPQSGVRVVETECNVTRNQLEEYFGEKFECECFAWSSRGQIRSRPVTVELAYMKKQFSVPPAPLSVEASQAASLRCAPPPAAPPPRLSWLKHGAPLQQDHNVVVSAEGNLLISKATLQDMANYTCVAENIAGKRTSEPALLTVFLSGGWSAWGAWAACRCGGRAASGQRRTRACTDPLPLNGGAPCQGQAVQRTVDCLPCQSAIPGRWGAWSKWSLCSAECLKTRRRLCAGVAAGCTGSPVQHAQCAGGYCATRYATQEVAATHDNTALYIGVVIAILVFIAGAGAAYALFRSKPRNTLYSIARSDLPPDMYPVVEKKSGAAQCYEYPLSSTKNRLDHHYDLPHLTSSYASPVDHQVMPCSSTESEDYESKPYSCSEHSNSSCFTNSGSTYDAATDSVTLQLAELVSNSATSVSMSAGGAGARLALPAVAVALSVCEGAIHYGRREQLYVSVVRDDRYRPHLSEGMTQLSPIVRCGPPRLQLSKPFVLQIPHCASLKHGYWNIFMYGIDHGTPRHESLPRWKKISTVGKETINTPVFTQVDINSVFVITEFLSTFVLVGESLGGKAVKCLQIAIYFQCISSKDNLYEIRLSVFDDTSCALLMCQEQEEILGGILLDQPSSLLFQDEESDLYVALQEINLGWRIKAGTSSQEISFSEIWNAGHNIIKRKYVLQRTGEEDGRNFVLSAYQQINPTFKVTFSFELPSCFQISKLSETGIKITENMLGIGILTESSMQAPNSNSISPKLMTVDNLKMNDVNASSFRLSAKTKKQLCVILDSETISGNNWRLLAKKLNVDRFITWFATKNSPTEYILDLWECRHRTPCAVSELATILCSMDRQDAVDVLGLTSENSWL